MRSPNVLASVLVLAFSGALAGQQLDLVPQNGGSGADGAFAPLTNMTLDTGVQRSYEFTQMLIPAGVTVRAVGPFPLTIKVQGQVLIDGILDVSGAAGVNGGNGIPGGPGGFAGAGGGAGGEGGAPTSNLFNGSGANGGGLGGGQGGTDAGPVPGTFTDPVGGGGGGGNATAGTAGGLPNAGTLPSVSGLGGPAVAPRGGGGGGGGGGDIDDLVTGTANDGGGGGGGGGGRLSLLCDGLVTINGAILANGGAGGTSTGNGGAGGGGAGGSIEIVAPAIVHNGTMSAVGGAGGAATQTNCGCSPGGAGGDGAIFLAGNLAGAGSATPAPAVVQAPCLFLNQDCQVAQAGVIGAGTTYFAAISGSLGAPIPVGGGLFVDLELNDPLLMATFPVNTLAGIVGGVSGSLPGAFGLNLTGLVPPNVGLTGWGQALSVSGGAPVAVSPPMFIAVRF